MVDIGRPHVDAVLTRVPYDLCRRVKAHWLCIQKRRGKSIRIAAFQPGRGIDQKRKARGVTFRKAVFAEAFDLLEASLGEVAFVAVSQHAVDHLALESADGTDALEGRHGAAKPIGLRG